MIQQKQNDLKPWEKPLEEEYWLALLHQEEHAVHLDSLPDQAPSLPETDEQQTSDSNPYMIEEAPVKIPEINTPTWEMAKTYLQEGTAITMSIVGYNRGGLLVDWNGWEGFVPASQLIDFPTNLTEEERRDKLAARVGQESDFKLIELDRENDRLIFSEKAVISPDDQSAQLLNAINAGDILTGKVTNLCSFGAFVDLGGVEGLIHVSELSWGRVAHPSDVLQVGQETKVYVLNIDKPRKRIGLSLKHLTPDPWNSLQERYTEGQLVQGVITNVVSFGAFVRIEKGVEGLIHLSELAEDEFTHPRNVVREGNTVTVRIMNIDGDNHRLRLSLRQARDEMEQGGAEPL
ncbi:MAG: hypothetical protein B6I34_04595 [Anaerolineaceae bacterium 4572_32.1]|nr:MAG: hypothetical protein B6I34_04595 [Anaerolineaceae bacterium 4572_32.1]